MGNVTDYDRPFKVEIDKEMSTGIQGVHFDTNLDTLKIKAGKSNAYVRITFYRTPDLLDSTLTVVRCIYIKFAIQYIFCYKLWIRRLTCTSIICIFNC